MAAAAAAAIMSQPSRWARLLTPSSSRPGTASPSSRVAAIPPACVPPAQDGIESIETAAAVACKRDGSYTSPHNMASMDTPPALSDESTPYTLVSSSAASLLADYSLDSMDSAATILVNTQDLTSTAEVEEQCSALEGTKGYWSSFATLSDNPNVATSEIMASMEGCKTSSSCTACHEEPAPDFCEESFLSIETRPFGPWGVGCHLAAALAAGDSDDDREDRGEASPPVEIKETSAADDRIGDFSSSLDTDPTDEADGGSRGDAGIGKERIGVQVVGGPAPGVSIGDLLDLAAASTPVGAIGLHRSDSWDSNDGDEDSGPEARYADSDDDDGWGSVASGSDRSGTSRISMDLRLASVDSCLGEGRGERDQSSRKPTVSAPSTISATSAVLQMSSTPSPSPGSDISSATSTALSLTPPSVSAIHDATIPTPSSHPVNYVVLRTILHPMPSAGPAAAQASEGAVIATSQAPAALLSLPPILRSDPPPQSEGVLDWRAVGRTSEPLQPSLQRPTASSNSLSTANISRPLTSLLCPLSDEDLPVEMGALKMNQVRGCEAGMKIRIQLL